MSKENKDFLKAFQQYGLNFAPSSDGLNYPTRCPFSDKEGKLVVNKLTGQWQSFTGGVSGNLYTFLSLFYELCLKKTIAKDLSNLSMNRNLPVPAFAGDVAYNHLNGTYLIPCRNSNGSINNLGYYYPGKFVRRTAGCNVGLKNIDKIPSNNHPIYLCEGEWDMYALNFILKQTLSVGIVCCVPGANVFKDSWIPSFTGRKVYVCYDNDKAGYQGQEKVKDALITTADELWFLAWPELFKDKYDVRDFICEYAGPTYGKTKMKKALEILHGLFSRKTKFQRDNPSIPDEQRKANVPIPSRKELEDTYKKWLKMDNADPLVVMFGSCFANMVDGDPVWTFLVAPPGGSKTELLMTLSLSPFIECMTTLTSAALISGKTMGNNDRSMLPKINGRMLVIKDFTTILTGNAYQRDEVFGILRDVFDGKIDKFFGTGEKKTYYSRFGIIAGVTPIVDSYTTLNSSLGERFIKFRLDKTLFQETERERIIRAITNINSETKMKKELVDMGFRMLELKVSEKLPECSNDVLQKIISLAQFCARLRGSVPKDKFTHEQTSSPITEIGTRLAKQFMKQAIGQAIYLREDYISDYNLKLIKQIAFDTPPALISNLIKDVFLKTNRDGEADVTQRWICEKTGLTSGTVSHLVGDLMTLKILIRTKGDHRIECRYILAKNILDLINTSGIFSDDIPEPEKSKFKTIIIKKGAKK